MPRAEAGLILLSFPPTAAGEALPASRPLRRLIRPQRAPIIPRRKPGGAGGAARPRPAIDLVDEVKSGRAGSPEGEGTRRGGEAEQNRTHKTPQQNPLGSGRGGARPGEAPRLSCCWVSCRPAGWGLGGTRPPSPPLASVFFWGGARVGERRKLRPQKQARLPEVLRDLRARSGSRPPLPPL